ncbi:hypothetical protein BpHYR1_005464 [Brachionus plicatilis]|uniref:Uncharacterized protein n=1 Tax=Brachionus plicatilis TaxID=10195 RepID=A0A3M7S2S3_BRAPC|nr:hypothetical protein BpHYR1_005464 [Brachionus plicatilis]
MCQYSNFIDTLCVNRATLLKYLLLITIVLHLSSLKFINHIFNHSTSSHQVRDFLAKIDRLKESNQSIQYSRVWLSNPQAVENGHYPSFQPNDFIKKEIK